MLEHLGLPEEAARDACHRGDHGGRYRHARSGGTASTRAVGDAVVASLDLA